MLIPLLILLMVLFGGLLLLLRIILSRLATQATGHLKVLSQETLAQQEALKKRLTEAEGQYREQLVKAKEEADRIRSESLQKTQLECQKMLEHAHQEAERITQQAIHGRQKREEELMASMEKRVLERACELVQEVLPMELRETTHADWLDRIIKDGLIPLERLKTQEKIHEVQVTSAFPLTPSQRKQLLERFQTVLGSSLTLKETVDPRIIAGLVVTLGHSVLDGSLVSKLKEVVRHAQDAAE